MSTQHVLELEYCRARGRVDKQSAVSPVRQLQKKCVLHKSVKAPSAQEVAFLKLSSTEGHVIVSTKVIYVIFDGQ